MKFELLKRISFFELNPRFELRLRGLLNCLQEAAGLHSQQAGHGAGVLMEQGKAWMLYRIGLKFHRLPALGDELRIVTWHKGAQGFRAYRDFEIFCGRQKIISATTMWFFIDLPRKKILKIPKDVADRFGLEPEPACDTDLSSWEPDSGLQLEKIIQIQTRPSDYDPLGHVNNAIYFDYLETLLEQGLRNTGKFQSILMQFNKEIPNTVSMVEAGLKQEGELIRFILASPGCVHALGECSHFS